MAALQRRLDAGALHACGDPVRSESEVRERLRELSGWRDAWIESAAATLRCGVGIAGTALNAEAAVSLAKGYDHELAALRWVLGEPEAQKENE